MAVCFIFRITEPKRAFHLEAHAEEHGEFSDTASAPDFKTKRRAVALISFNGETIAYAALATRGQRVATAKYRITFTRLIDLREVTVGDLRKHMPKSRLRTVMRFLRNDGGTLSQPTWNELFAALRTLRPQTRVELRSLVEFAETLPRSYHGHGYETVAQEKDAFFLAAQIFGVDRRMVARLLSPHRTVAPFLDSLPAAARIEDIMIQKDKATIPNWIASPESQVGSVVMRRSDGRELTVVNVNRTSIEETLGVDLIYYNHSFRSFVMVQYKVMESEEGEDGRLTAVYRPIDRSYKKEFARIESYLMSRPPATPATCEAFRLASNGFLFKLCPRITFDPLSTTPIAGMYLPFEYWKLLIASPQARGPKGGVKITYDNAGRYFDNTLFVRLVEDGWVGSPVDEERTLSDLIRAGLKGDRSVLYAATSGARRGGRGRAPGR